MLTQQWSIPSRKEIRQRAASVRKTWSPNEKASRRNSLPPDSVLRLATVEFFGPSRHRAG